MEGRVRDSKREELGPQEESRQPVGTESSSQGPASQEAGPQSHSHKELDSANKRGGFFPRSSRQDPSPVDTLISALWDPEQKTRPSRDFWPTGLWDSEWVVFLFTLLFVEACYTAVEKWIRTQLLGRLGKGVSGWTVMIATKLGCRREFSVKQREEMIKCPSTCWKPALGCTALYSGHMWILSTWKVASLNWDML